MVNNGISVIIPALNEERNIKACIESAKKLNLLEIIVVDGGSTDRTKEIAMNAGAIVVKSPKGRGVQMNKGASLARGEILLFLHADTLISEEVSSLFHPDPERDSGDSRSQEMLKRPMKQVQSKVQNDILGKYIGGFFKLKFDDDSLSTRLVELFANIRSRLFLLPYGDQAMFIRRDTFEKIGGFREYPFLEDIDMALRLRKIGSLKYIPLPVTASVRRIKKGYPLSPIPSSLRNVAIVLLFILGISPYKLIKFYR
ncbi:MAG: glycosyltransferase [Nitrospira sp.]|nr:glycosyltransferase [Nitrospira sp.]